MVPLSYTDPGKACVAEIAPIMPFARVSRMTIARDTVSRDLVGPAGTAAADGSAPTVGATGKTEVRECVRCGEPVSTRRRTSKRNEELCVACDQRERRAAYFRTYYEEHKDRILDKNRRWAKDNKSRIVQLRQARRVKNDDSSATVRTCLDCDASVTRASRCRRCYIRFRYATDTTYRERRLATTRRWLEKRQHEAARRAGTPSERRVSATALARSN